MSLYGRFVLPRLVHLACGLKANRLQRAKIVPLACGDVLEIGFGSGLNLPYYDPTIVSRVWALEPSQDMWQLAGEAIKGSPVRVELVNASAEEIPLRSGSVDTILVTYSLCTIADAVQALRESRRVLKPGGSLLFCEHGAAPEEDVRRWQDRLNPVWRRVAGGCNLNRAIPSLIEAGGFHIRNISAMYIPGWRPASYNYWGVALHR